MPYKRFSLVAEAFSIPQNHAVFVDTDFFNTHGWGIFFAHPWGTFDLTGQEGAFLPTEETPTRDVFVVLAETPAELMKEWAELTGYPHMPPLWSLGYQQSHRTLESREAILAEAKRFRADKLPCDAMIYLGTGFCPAGGTRGMDPSRSILRCFLILRR